MDRKPIYGIGDKVKIINYGHPIFESIKNPQMGGSFKVISEDEEKDIRIIDMAPEVVGQVGYVCQVEMTQGTPQYAIEGLKGKHAWFDEDQMELVNKNPNN